MLLVYIILALGINCYEGKDVPVKIDLMQPATIVDRKFLSVTIESGMIHEGFQTLASEKLTALAKGLTPSGTIPEIYLRIGGTSADHIIFDPTMNILNVTELDLICKFANNLGWKLIFGLNVLLRSKDGAWNPSNALVLINYLNEKNFSMNYELGNEPDLFPAYLNITVAPKQLAKDYQLLHYLLREVTGGKSMLIGPDIASITRDNYFAEFLSHVSEHDLDAVTFHHYYSSSHVSVQDFTDIKYLDRFLSWGLQALHIIKRSFSTFPHPPVWLGETSSTWGGGSPGLGESFAAGFLWLDKLGLAAQMNISVVLRQCLIGGFYSLINNKVEPAPDYWSTLLYKRLMGPAVLNITGYLKYNREVRIYSHCINRLGGHQYGSSSLVLMVLNLSPTENANIRIVMDGWSDLIADLYLFQPAYGHLNDQHVTLNGVLLKMLNDSTLPPLTPVHVAQPYIFPPLSYGFLVVLNSTVPACKKY